MEDINESRVAESVDRDARTWALASHLLGLGCFVLPWVGNVVGPLIVYLVKGETSQFVKDHARESLNFQITMDIYYVIAALLCFLFIGFVIIPALLVFDIVVIIMAAIQANDGRPYRYPLCFRFIS